MILEEKDLGVLTKVDLMNEATDITHLDNNVSKDLQLQYGLFGIKNRNKVESESMSAIDGLKAENDYFNKHLVYGNKKYKDKLGVPALGRNLSSILVKNLKKCFPLILEKINRELDKNILELSKLGTAIPEGNDHKAEFLHKNIAKLIRTFVSIIDDRGKIINTGRNIKKHLIEFRENIGKSGCFFAIQKSVTMFI